LKDLFDGLEAEIESFNVEESKGVSEMERELDGMVEDARRLFE
jgi:hypothetical protein